jgi:hypothetical protein
MDRKTFIKKRAGAILIGLLVYSFLGCSSSNDGEDETPTPDANCAGIENGMAVSIASNHGHTLTVSKADIAAGTKKTFTIKGSALHHQNITLSADDFKLLKNNSSITVNSSATEGGIDVMHIHSVSVSCE